jgi:Tol biopolymer transport system component
LPDGRRLAFVASDKDVSLLWVRSLETGAMGSLPATEGASFPFWKPDGSAIGFFAGSKLKRIDPNGGAAQTLANAPSGRGGAWNRDDAIVFAPETNAGLMQVRATGGEMAKGLTRFTLGDGSHRWPQFLPDGRRFLFFMGQGDDSRAGVYIGSLDGGDPARVLPTETAAVYASGYLLHVSQDVLLALPFDADRGEVTGEPVTVAHSVGSGEGIFRGLFSASETGVLIYRQGTGARRQFVWFDRAGTTLGAAGPVDDQVPSGPELSPDDRRLAFMSGRGQESDIWVMELATGNKKRLTHQGGGLPIWSLPGDRLIFHRGNPFALYEQSLIAGAAEQLFFRSPKNGGITAQDLSRDGTLLYAVRDDHATSSLWAVQPAGDRKPMEVVVTAHDEGQGQFSPDGRLVAYVSNETGSHEVYVEPFPGPADKVKISTNGGIYPRWSRDDRQELTYVSTPDMYLMAAQVRLGPDNNPFLSAPAVSLFRTRLATGAYILTAGGAAKAQYDVARDGRFLMNVAVDDVAPPITVVLNWTATLRQGK